MAIEIERKFLLKDESWRAGASGVLYRQGYLVTDLARVVRVRVMGGRAALTIKTQRTGATRGEWEYEIPIADADEMLAEICLRPLIEKTRYRVAVGKHIFEIDEFAGANTGLTVAEIELGSENESFERPSWLGVEVTDDPRYLNANLVEKPYSTW